MDEERARDTGITVDHTGDAATLRVSGELDESSAGDLIWTCRSLYARGARNVVIDLTDTSFLDSSGLRALILANHVFGEGDGTLRLSHPTEPAMRLIEVAGLAAYFAIDEVATD